MQADTGPIGGDLSHEFLVLAETGESKVFCHKDILEFDITGTDIDYSGDLQPVVDKWTSLYAATDEKASLITHAELGDNLLGARGIEVGHIFYFGDKYSKAMGATVTGPDGKEIILEMGSYGIGVSRLVGAIIEASHDSSGIIWPESVAPFKVGIINLRRGDNMCDSACENVYNKLQNAKIEVLYDDRDESGGSKFANMDLIGLPWQLVFGPRGLKEGKIEIKNRATGDKEECSIDAAVAKLAG
jgi:prolyl-tRNA synthetase